MKKIVLFCIFLLNISQLSAQIQSAPIEIKKNFLGATTYYQNGKFLRPGQLFKITITDSAAYKETNIARINNTLSYISAFSSSFAFTWALIVWIPYYFSENPALNPLLPAITGSVFLVTSVSLAISNTKHIKRAVNIYNEGIKQSGLKNVQLGFGIIHNGIGLMLTF